MRSLDDVRLRYVALGHLTRDRDANGTARLGGSVSYAGLLAARLGVPAGIVSCASRRAPSLDELAEVALAIRWSAATTTFENLYDRRGARRQRVLAVAPALAPGDVPRAWRAAEVIHLAPVVAEVGADMVGVVPASAFVGVTPQGWLREVGVDGAVRPGRWRVPEEVVARADAMVLSEEDLALEPGRADWLASRVPIVVLTRGADGVRAQAQGRTYEQAGLPARTIDPTGAGDVFAAAFFVHYRQSGSVGEGLRFGAAAAALAVGGAGLAGVPSRAQIEALLAVG